MLILQKQLSMLVSLTCLEITGFEEKCADFTLFKLGQLFKMCLHTACVSISVIWIVLFMTIGKTSPLCRWNFLFGFTKNTFS